MFTKTQTNDTLTDKEEWGDKWQRVTTNSAKDGNDWYNEWLILTKLLAVYHYISWGYCKLWWPIAAFEKKLSKSRKNFHNQEKLLESRKKTWNPEKYFRVKKKENYEIWKKIMESTEIFQNQQKCFRS